MNQLVHEAEFRKILQNYQIAPTAEQLLKEVKLVLLGGASGSGRNTIVEKLVAAGNYEFIVSDTTRQPRVNDGKPEKNGVNYWFRSEEQFLADLTSGLYLEAEVIHSQQVSGISIRELAKASGAGKVAITDVEIGGFINIMSRKPDTVGILILPPGFDVWLQRLTKRSQLPEDEVVRRLTTGLTVFREALENDHAHVVVNNTLDETVSAVDKIAHGRLDGLGPGKKTAKTLIDATTSYLSFSPKG